MSEKHKNDHKMIKKQLKEHQKCDVKNSLKRDQKSCSLGQRKRYIKRTLQASALCVAATGCETVQCLVITPSKDGNLKIQMSVESTQSFSQETKPNKTNPLKSAAGSALDAALKGHVNGL